MTFASDIIHSIYNCGDRYILWKRPSFIIFIAIGRSNIDIHSPRETRESRQNSRFIFPVHLGDWRTLVPEYRFSRAHPHPRVIYQPICPIFPSARFILAPTRKFNHRRRPGAPATDVLFQLISEQRSFWTVFAQQNRRGDVVSFA